MKKMLLTLVCICGLSTTLSAGNGEKYLGLAGGYSLANALDFMLTFEKESQYYISHELFAEFYDSRRYGSWKYLQEYRGGYAAKFPLARGKNTMLRLRTGLAIGADQDGFTGGVQVGFELTRTLYSGSAIFLSQKNEYCLWTPRPWRNGLMVGFRFPF